MANTDGAGEAGLPILLANGFSPFPLPLHLVREHFAELGFESRVVPFSLADMRDVVRYAGHVVRSADRLLAERRCGRINLLGYSMGGVAALYAVKRLGLADRVAVLVTLGSPLRGSPASWFALPTGLFTRTGVQLLPDSAFLKRLHADPLPAGPRYVSVVGAKDHVCPPASAVLEGADAVIRVPIGHARFLVEPDVARLVAPHLS